MANIKDLPAKAKELGLKVIKSVEKGVENVRMSVEKTVLDDNLRRRFNLENPYKFEVYEKGNKSTMLTNLFVRNAKRYEEDDLFVFAGSISENKFEKGGIIKDLAQNAEFRILDIIHVLVPVEYEGKRYEIGGTALHCQPL